MSVQDYEPTDSAQRAVWRGFDYAKDVIEGRRKSGQFEIQAVERFIADLERDDWVYEFDHAEAARWCEFLERLQHVKGRWAKNAERLTLSGWQAFVVINIYGWRHKRTGFRRFREAYIEVARKNGKSTLLAGIADAHLCIDDEFGAEVYCGATSEKQAMEVFRPARLMLVRDEELRSEYDVEINAKTLVIQSDGSRFEPVIGDPGDGSSPSCAIHDEFHEHANSNQVDTMATGMGAREQPLQIYITTAGSSIGGPCYEKRAECISVLSGAVHDDTVFAVVYTIDDGDKWNDENSLEKANPNLDVSVSRDYLLAEMRKAERTPTKQVAFRTKHLNQWVGAKAAWMNMLKLQLCGVSKEVKIERHIGGRCFIGLDLASKIDIASMCLLFPYDDRFAAFWKRWLPYEAVYESGNPKFKAWAEAGLVTVTDGDIIDLDQIEDELIALRGVYDIQACGYDPFQATQFASHMLDEGFPMIEVGQTVKNFSEPMKEVEGVIYDRRFEYDKNDLMVPWSFGNVVAQRDKKQNIFPNKERETAKIDDVVSLLIAMNRALMGEEQGDMAGFFSKPVSG